MPMYEIMLASRRTPTDPLTRVVVEAENKTEARAIAVRDNPWAMVWSAEERR